MDEKRLTGEQMLRAWLNLSSTVWNRRVVSTMTFNELSVCSLLKYRMDDDPKNRFTATELCEKTGLFKSQMNKILNSMENKGLIERVRSEKDKRFVYIELTEEGVNRYNIEHDDIMTTIDSLVESIGIDADREATASVNMITKELKKLM